MNTLSAVLFACLAVSAFAGHYDDGQWRGHGAYPGDHRAGLVGGGWNGGHVGLGLGLGLGVGHIGLGLGGGVGIGDGGWDDGSWDDGDDGSYGGHGHGHYSNAVAGNGAITVGAAGPIVNDVGHGHGVAIVGPPTATVKVVGPGRTGSIVAHGLWGPTHAHGHGHGHGW